MIQVMPFSTSAAGPDDGAPISELTSDFASCAFPQTEGRTCDGCQKMLQSMETKRVYLWLLHVRRGEVQKKTGRKLEKTELIAIRFGNFPFEGFFAGKSSPLETERFYREIQAVRELFCWD